MSIAVVPPAAPWVVRSFESDEIESILHEMPGWDMRWMQLSTGDGNHRVTAALVGEVRFLATTATAAFHAEGATPSGLLTLQFDRASSAERVLGGKTVGVDEILVGTGGAAFDVRLAERHSGFNFGVPLRLATQALAARAPAMSTPRGVGVIEGTSAPARRVRALADSLLHMAASGTADARCAALSSCAAVDAMIGALLAPWHRAGTATWRAPRYQRLPVVRRAEAFMRACLGEPLMLHDICAAARASERTVEYAFHDVYGMGAKQYLRLLRLDRARRALRQAGPDETSVQAVARAAGFWHMGRFSIAYRDLFGESPSRTLGTSPPAARIAPLHMSRAPAWEGLGLS